MRSAEGLINNKILQQDLKTRPTFCRKFECGGAVLKCITQNFSKSFLECKEENFGSVTMDSPWNYKQQEIYPQISSEIHQPVCRYPIWFPVKIGKGIYRTTNSIRQISERQMAN